MRKRQRHQWAWPVRGMLPVGLWTWSMAFLCSQANLRAQRPAASTALLPEMRIGATAERDQGLTRVPDLAVAANSAVFVLQSEERLIRVFDRDGRFVRTIGREGEGPGEFRQPLAPGWRADTLWVWDARLNRVSVFQQDGVFLRSFRLPVPGGAMLSAAGYLLEPFVYPGRGSGGAAPLLLMNDGGDIIDTLALIPEEPLQQGIRVGGWMLVPLFLEKTLWSVSEDGGAVFLVERKAARSERAATFRVTKLSIDADTVFSLAYEYQPVRIDDEILRRAVAGLVEQFSRRITSLPEATVREAVTRSAPEYLPPVTMIAPDRRGGLWIRREDRFVGPVVWERIDSTGGKAPALVVPRNVRIYLVDCDVAWAVEEDELGVPYVVRYRIQGSASICR